MASAHSGMASFLVLLLQAEQQLKSWTTMTEAMCLHFLKSESMKCAILKYGSHSTGLAPEGDVFLNITFPENSSLIQTFTATLSDAAADEDRAKKMYLETLAPGTVSPPVYLCQHKDYAKS